MTALAEVLADVEDRVGYLRAVTAVPDEAGWVGCDAVTAEVIEAALVGSKAAPDRVVATSLLIQSYAFRVSAISLAAYAVGLAWPDPSAAGTAVRLGGGRASGLALLTDRLGSPEDAAGLAAAVARHLGPVVDAVHATTRLGARLVEGNIAAATAASFRSVEGAARQRGDGAERTAIRRRASDYLQVAGVDAGAFSERDDEWVWTRTSCCLWYRTSERFCEDCSMTRSVA